ncbi:MAG: hypothetical protein ACUVRV_04625 [Cyanobacteriota bacterium]
MHRVLSARYPTRKPHSPGKLRVGIVSGLFRDHSVWKILTRG